MTSLIHNSCTFLRRWLAYAWVAPTTCVGLLFLTPLPLPRTWPRLRSRVVDGVIEVSGGIVAVFLRHGTLLQGGAAAMTLGHVVLGLDEFHLEQTREHERVHVRQAERWGPAFIPAYLVASLIVYLRGQDPYLDNPFEREAYSNPGCAPLRRRNNS